MLRKMLYTCNGAVRCCRRGTLLNEGTPIEVFSVVKVQ